MAMTIGPAVGDSAVAGTPSVGASAPTVSVLKWMDKTPPVVPGAEKAKDAKGNVFVVEFWATWCAPCKRSIPHLGELQKKHGDDGLIVLGISNEEISVVEKFMKDTKMGYYVGVDNDMATNDAWMEDIMAFPFAFVVDRTGVVVWRGNPLDTASLDDVVDRVIKGTFDVEAARNEAANEAKYNELMMKLGEVSRQEDKTELNEIIDELIKLRPTQTQPYLIRHSLLMADGKEKKLRAWDAKILDAFKDSPQGLTELAQLMMSRNLEICDFELLVKCASRANELCQGRDPTTLGVLADALARVGRIEEAARLEEEAVALSPEELKPFHVERLASYRRAIAAGKAYDRMVKKDGEEREAVTSGGEGSGG